MKFPILKVGSVISRCIPYDDDYWVAKKPVRRFKYFRPKIDDTMTYRVAVNPNQCDFVVVKYQSKWQPSCCNTIQPADFRQVSRDDVRKQYPKLF